MKQRGLALPLPLSHHSMQSLISSFYIKILLLSQLNKHRPCFVRATAQPWERPRGANGRVADMGGHKNLANESSN